LGSHLSPETAEVGFGADVEAAQVGVEVGVGGPGGEQDEGESD
jgi:hypothetical protein